LMSNVKSTTVKAILEANSNLRPAKLAYAQNLNDADVLVKDTRKPIVKDSGIRLIQAIDAENGSTLGVVVGWANHPETVWSRNLLISSDFPHYIREGIEKGLIKSSRKMKLIVTLIDKPGSLAKLSELFENLRANIVQIDYDRTSKSLDYGDAFVSVSLETRGKEHQEEIKLELKKYGFEFSEE